MFSELIEISKKPQPFEFYTAPELWTDVHISKKMLEFHLNRTVDAASRNMDFIERSCAWIDDHFRLGLDFSVADFGCGPGLYTSRLAETGAKITGIDFSLNSLDYAIKEAKEKGLPVNYVHSNYLEFESEEKFDLLTMIFCDFTVLSPAQRSRLLKKFRGLLKPGGSVLIDVYSLNYFNSKEEKAIYEFDQKGRFWFDDDYFTFMNSFKYEEERLLLDKYSVFSERGSRCIYNWYQCYSIDSIKREFEVHGLEISEIYANVAGDAYDPAANEFSVVAKLA